MFRVILLEFVVVEIVEVFSVVDIVLVRIAVVDIIKEESVILEVVEM